VPRVTGKPLAVAKQMIVRGHCRTGEVSHADSPSRVGVVLSQSRKPGTVLPANSKITLVVSRGPR
jgi:beta-lactam-binding protein with PASTA domain